MGGRAKAKGRGGGRGGRGGGGRGRGRSAHGSGGRFGWGGGGAGPSSSRGGGIYGPDAGGDYVALKGASPGGFFPGYGGGPKRKHRQMHQAYAYAGAGGRRVRRQGSDDDSETTSEEDVAGGGAPDHDHDHDEDEDEDRDDDESDPNVERNSVMRIGGIEIRMDRPGARGRGAREPFPPRREAPSVDDDVERDSEGEWGSELSLDSDAIDDYMRNCMDDSDDSDDDDDDSDDAFDEDAAADAAVAAVEEAWERSERDRYGGAPPDDELPKDIDGREQDKAARAARRAAREDRYLRRMRDMNLDGAEVPSPRVSDSDDSGSDVSDDSEAENEALKGGDYGAYLWGTGSAGKKKKGAGGHHADGGFPSSGKRAAKKAARKAARRGESPERDAGLRRPRAVAETLAGMIRFGGAYIGFQAGMSPDALRGLLGIAHAMGLKAEVRGGGKRRHVVVHWTPRARVPRDGDERLERAIAAAEGQPYGGGGGGRGGVSGRNGTSSAPSFVSAGVMRNDDDDIDDDDRMDVPVGDVDDEAKPEAETDFPIEGESAGLGTGLTRDEVEAELAAADADVRAAEAFLTAAAEGAADGDGVEDDGEEVRRGNRGLRRAAMAAERELRASLAQRKKKGDGRVVGAGHSFGAFEAHTSGFGSRMLAKMGFQGEGAGMGKDGRGISEPIAASIRGKRVGLGAERK